MAMEENDTIEGLHDFYFQDLTTFYKTSFGKSIPETFYDFTEEERKKCLLDLHRRQYPSMPESLNYLWVASFYGGDCGRSSDSRPEWLDLEQFRRGQAVIKRYLYGISLNIVISTALSLIFHGNLKAVIMTGKSRTPYTSFKRYISTINIVNNWFFNDPFKKDTSAFEEIQFVRKLHVNIRKKFLSTTAESLRRSTTIKNAWCPAYESLIQDLRNSCPESNPEQCPFSIHHQENSKTKGMNQAEMSLAQFSFVGLAILNPKAFGMTNITEQELEDYCYVWRCLGYLLGIEDEFNFCRGSLQEIQQRATDFLEIWLKPSLPHVNPEWEHMMRCMVEGMRYYTLLPSFDILMHHSFHLIDVKTSCFKQRITLLDWIWFKTLMFTFGMAGRFPGIANILNQVIIWWLKNGNEFSALKHKKLRQMSADILALSAHPIKS